MNQRAERIKNEINIEDVLSSYGYEVYVGNGEQQFKCDLHGDGTDNTPSARVYPQSNTWFCFACGRSRDSISTIMEKEGLSFNDSCTALEGKYGLSQWVYKKRTDDLYSEKAEDKEGFEIIRERSHRKLINLTKSREVDLEIAVKLWEGYDLLNSLNFQSKELWSKLYMKIP